MFQFIYSNLFPKYFCRIDNYGVKGKMAFVVAYAGYHNWQESLYFEQLLAVKQEKTESDETREAIECPLPPCSPSKPAVRKPK